MKKIWLKIRFLKFGYLFKLKIIIDIFLHFFHIKVNNHLVLLVKNQWEYNECSLWYALREKKRYIKITIINNLSAFLRQATKLLSNSVTRLNLKKIVLKTIFVFLIKKTKFFRVGLLEFFWSSFGGSSLDNQYQIIINKNQLKEKNRFKYRWCMSIILYKMQIF